MSMENIRSNRVTTFYICESYTAELKAVTKRYDNVVIEPYRAKCKYHNIDDPFEKLKPQKDAFILGGCTIEPDNIVGSTAFHKEENCFYMFAPKTLVQSYMENGAYIITPGWLSHWRRYVTELWGFERDNAQIFFKEFCKKLVLLNTQVNNKSNEQLREFAKFVDRPYEIVPIGLEFFQLYVDSIINQEKLKNSNREIKSRLDESLRDTANYAMAFDLLSIINKKVDEKEITDSIKEIFTMLFASENITYMAIKDSKIIENLSSSIDSETSAYLFNIEDSYRLYDDGFAVKLIYDNQTVGIVSVENIAFVQYIYQYLNLAISISSVCALAIENARSKLKTKEIEAQLIQHAKLVEMGEMMGSIAHQWRQPLNELNINIEMLEEYYNLEEIDENFIDAFIEKNIKIIYFLSKTITDFSNFFRINKQKVHFSIKESIENTLDIIQMQLNKHNIIFEMSGEDSKVFGLPSEFQQVILNIINNAKDAIVESKIENGKIEVELLSKDSFATVTIKDNGGGVSPNTIERIFEPYFTTKEQGKGIGMGLYISKMIIEEALGGELSAKNSDRGALFKIKLELNNE